MDKRKSNLQMFDLRFREMVPSAVEILNKIDKNRKGAIQPATYPSKISPNVLRRFTSDNEPLNINITRIIKDQKLNEFILTLALSNGSRYTRKVNIAETINSYRKIKINLFTQDTLFLIIK